MNAVDLYNTISKYFTDLRNTYGDNIESVEAYDGKIIVHFKKEYLEEEIARRLLNDIVDRITKTIWGGGITNEN